MAHVDEFCAVIDPAGLDILDIGAGNGEFVHALCKRGARAVGVEAEPAKVVRAQAANDVSVLLGCGEEMPVGYESYDVVTFTYSLHYVPPQLQQKDLSEAARVLRPDG